MNDRWAYKLSAGYFTQDPLPRPTGTIPNAFNTPYPPLHQQGHVAAEVRRARRLRPRRAAARSPFAGGVAGTEGIIHTGIGPFDIVERLADDLLHDALPEGRRAASRSSPTCSTATRSNLLARGTDGQPLPLDFDTKTFDVEAQRRARRSARTHVLSYGGNFRHNTFDISLAPTGDDRNEGGGYLQDEIFLSDHFRWVVGGRVDKFSSIDDAVFSPRTTFMSSRTPAQTFRVSFNRAFRAPSFINNHIDTTILNEVNLSAISPALARFVFPIARGRQPGPEAGDDDGVRDRLHRRDPQPRAR